MIAKNNMYPQAACVLKIALEPKDFGAIYEVMHMHVSRQQLLLTGFY